MECSPRLHAPTVAPEALPRALYAATVGELGEAALEGNRYAFQAFDIAVMDRFPTGEADGDDYYVDGPPDAPGVVCLFGVDVDGRSVLVRVEDFRPFFFLEVPWYDPRRTQTAAARELHDEIDSCFPRHAPPCGHRFVCACRLGGYVPPNDGRSTGPRRFWYAKLDFPNIRSMRAMARALRRKFDARVCEDRIPLNLKFADALRSQGGPTGKPLEPCGWVGLTRVNVVGSRDAVSWCDVELHCSMADIRALPGVDLLAPLMVASWDIECISPSGEFPDPDKPEDQIVVIGTSYRRVGQPPRRPGAPEIGGTLRTSHVLRGCDPVPGVRVECFDTEPALLDGWSRTVVQEMRADCLLGYNVLGFDNRYCARRSQYWEHCEFMLLSKLRLEVAQLRTKMLSSSAMGDNEVHHIPMTGRFTLDLFQWVKNRFSNLKSLSLDAVARNFLGDQADDGKIALPYSRISEEFGPGGTPAGRAEVVAYCAQDCDLPLRLAEKLYTLQEVSEMSRVCQTPINDVLTRGQQIKVFSNLYITAHQMGFVVNEMPAEERSDKYTGATVLEPTPGYYHTLPITTLDFASLYPSIMRAENLSFDSWVPPGTRMPPHIATKSHDMGDGRVSTFVQESAYKGVLPRLLEALLGARKATRAKLKRLPKGSGERALLDGRQLAYKVCCNSVYGFCGANKGMYALKLIAETTTAVGREMIQTTKRTMETEFGARVIYGDTDSVMVEFPLSDPERKPEAELIAEAFELGERAAAVATAVFANCNELECEKVSFPYLLFGKKTYAARVFETPTGDPKLDVKGLAVVRRDTCDYAAATMRDTLNALMLDRSVADARRVVGDAVTALVRGQVPMAGLTLSKRLSGSYKNPQLPHLAVVAKMEERNPGSAPKSGDRVPFVIVEHPGDPKMRVFEKAEDPAYVEAHPETARIDRLHYLTNHLIKPVSQLFSPFDPEPARMFDPAIHELQRQRGGQSTLVGVAPAVFEYEVARPLAPPQPAKKPRGQVTLSSRGPVPAAEPPPQPAKKPRRAQNTLAAFL